MPPHRSTHRDTQRNGSRKRFAPRSDGAPERPSVAAPEGAGVATSTSLADYFGEHRDALIRYAYGIVRDRDAAEDVVQHAFVNTVAAVSGGTEIYDLSSWLHRCVRNLGLNRVNASQVFSLDAVEDPDQAYCLESRASAADLADLRESWRMVMSAVELLPDHLRDAFLLAEVQGLNYEEIAAELDRSTHSIRQILSRARSHVRKVAGSARLSATLLALLASALPAWPSSVARAIRAAPVAEADRAVPVNLARPPK